MGKIKTQLVKRLGLEVYKQYEKELTTDFRKNKELLQKVLKTNSKKMVNVLAGYLTKLKKKEEV